MKKSHEIEAGSWQRSAFLALCLPVKVSAFQIFLFVAMGLLFLPALLHGTLSTGTTYSINFVDIDGNNLSTSDGHVTIVVLTTTADREKARAVGDHVPDYCLGNPKYRMITIVHFTGRHTVIGRRIATTFIRHRVRESAKRLQARYDSQKLSRDAKGDIFVVTDFDGTAASQLGETAGAADFSVFVFGPTGELLKQWPEVPSAEQLASALK
ncbi:MAG TPA: hypothetical protein VGM65_16030 [Candidatus Udaeobacter sp.]|jgi:hypothetical protein